MSVSLRTERSSQAPPTRYTTVCMCACMCACRYACMCACMCACMYACMCACMYACMYAFTYACMHVCMYACMHTHPPIPTHAPNHPHTRHTRGKDLDCRALCSSKSRCRSRENLDPSEMCDPSNDAFLDTAGQCRGAGVRHHASRGTLPPPRARLRVDARPIFCAHSCAACSHTRRSSFPSLWHQPITRAARCSTAP